MPPVAGAYRRPTGADRQIIHASERWVCWGMLSMATTRLPWRPGVLLTRGGRDGSGRPSYDTCSSHHISVDSAYRAWKVKTTLHTWVAALEILPDSEQSGWFGSILTWLKARLLLCVSIHSSVASANWFSSCVFMHLLLCGSVSFGSCWHVDQVLYWLKTQMHANARDY